MSNKESAVVTENEIFKKFNSKNPNAGKPVDRKIWEDNRGHRKINYRIFSWISDKPDYWVHSSRFRKELDKYGMTPQIYYDIVCLGLTCVENRPVCEICGNSRKYINFFEGYRRFCTRSCADKWLEGRTYSSETIKKMSKSHVGLTQTVEARKKIGEANKRRVYTVEKRNQMSITMINALMDPTKMLRSKIAKGIKTGLIFSNKAGKELKYLSSWEKDFILMCDKNKEVIKLSSPDFSITYNWSDGSTHRYFPDFVLDLLSGQKILVEIKPNRLRNTDIVIRKRIAAKKWCKKYNYKYIILTEVELYKRINGSFNFYDFII